MKTNMGKSPEINPNPVLSISEAGIVLYSNDAGKPLLREWGVEVGKKVPGDIEDIVKKTISRNDYDKKEVNAGKKKYLLAFHPFPEEECVNIYGFNISGQKGLNSFMEKAPESESQESVNIKLVRNYRYPDGSVAYG